MPFLGAFMVTWFIFVMQYMWVWIDEFIGKGLEVILILKFLGLLSTTLVPIALPLGILFASIMTYGNLGETSELVAVKAAGISVAKFTRPLFAFILLITLLSFLFNNYVIPIAQVKASALIYDIQNKKPVVAIKAGTFYKGIQNHTIYLGSKESDGKSVNGIKIYDHTSGRGNDKITLAEKGKMYISDDKRFLIFELENGWRYEEKNTVKGNEKELTRLGFKYWKKVFDLSDFKMPKTNESYFKGLRAAMTVVQISHQIDTSIVNIKKMQESNKELLTAQLSVLKKDSPVVKQTPKMSTQTLFSLESVPDSLREIVLSYAEIGCRNIKSSLEVNKQNLKLQKMNLTEHYIEMHKRFTLPMACILLFIIGAALGSIIRKGGLGMPFIVAITFFVIYYVMNTVGEKIAKEEVVPVYIGMWLPSVILLFIGSFLMVKANNDSPIMNKEWYFRIFGFISNSKWFQKLKRVVKMIPS
jgi:lipopolysaccharide export system permease protein